MVAFLAFTGAACSDDSSQALDTVAPTTTGVVDSTTTTTTVVASTTSVADSTTTSTAAPTTTVPGRTTLGDGPWHTVASIPTVTEPGLYYELSLPGLYAYFPDKLAPNDQVFWTLNEADRPIIEAYLNAQLTINQAMLTRPMDFNLEGWDLYFEDSGAGMRSVLQPRSDDDLVLDMDLGIVLRPWIIDDARTDTTATVIDCEHNGALLKRSDGSLGPTSSPGWVINDYATSMVLVDGTWKVRFHGSWEEACTVYGPPYAF
jgi:hypothetical protein